MSELAASSVELTELRHDPKGLAVDTRSDVSEKSRVYECQSYASFTSVNVITQFVSQVLPPSSENACSNLGTNPG